jgi:hypothetical protein
MGKNHGGCEWPVTYVGEMKCVGMKNMTEAKENFA